MTKSLVTVGRSLGSLAALASAWVLIGVVGVGCGDDPLAFGELCERNGQCATGVCHLTDGVARCSQACDATAVCPANSDGSTSVCREDAFCGPHCDFSGMREGYICDVTSGDVVLCAEADDVDYCHVCGCASHGGGLCVTTLGCIDPYANGEPCPTDAACASTLCNPLDDRCTAPLALGVACSSGRFCESGLCHPVTNTCTLPFADGVACTADGFCVSGLCDPHTDVCVQPLADGTDCTADRYCQSGTCSSGLGCITPGPLDAPCSRDEECISNNCSTDGNWSATGQCNLALGSNCYQMENQCTACWSGFLSAFCSRYYCNANAPCPDNWSCLDNPQGGRSCYQRCDPNETSNSCFGDFRSCRWDGLCA